MDVVSVGLTADGVADLLGHVSDLVEGIRQEAVCLQEVEGAEGEQLEGDANVAVVVEPVQHLHAVAEREQKDCEIMHETRQKHRRHWSELTSCCRGRSL